MQGLLEGLDTNIPQARSRRVIALAESLGFGLCGVAPAIPSDHGHALHAWLADGLHGEMQYLADHAELRLDPRKLVDNALSVICVADAYAQDRPATEQAKGPANLARYAWGDDYHNVLKKRLFKLADALREQHPDAVFRCTTDTAPLLEREHAARAGLGYVGRNTMLIHPRHGSYTLLGCVVTTLDLATSEQLDYTGKLTPPTDHCGHCTRCIDACPTDAIAPAGYSIDATRCISYLTLEHRSPIAPGLQPAMAGHLAGCDICQDVCPHNQTAQRNPLPTHPRYAPRNTRLDPAAVLDWTEDDRRAAFQGSALKRMKLGMVQRNALITLHQEQPTPQPPAWRDRLQQLADDSDRPELLRQTAQQLLASQSKPAG
ncbi:MAG: tRNA epoxyqueuosine(34) reductase QueG [Planctomycetota bacterium]